jgi:uncharacterized membrane protein
MVPSWEFLLGRWRNAGLIDAHTADRIRAFENLHAADSEDAGASGMRWPVIVAITFGCVMVGAGILLFVAAHWDNLSPAERFAVVLSMVAGFHLIAAFFAERFPNLSIALHAVGTGALGAGIFLGGQIFNLAEHWPGGFMLWALGSGIGWWLLRDWPQGAIFAVLFPAWLLSEWDVAVTEIHHSGYSVAAIGVLTLAITYFTAVTREHQSLLRRSLSWIGGLWLLPAIGCVIGFSWSDSHPNRLFYPSLAPVPLAWLILGWTTAVVVPLFLAYHLNVARLWTNGLATLWVLALSAISTVKQPWNNFGVYLWCLAGSIASIYWGLQEYRKERINMGMAIFALTLLTFYFSNILDKMGRAMSLISLGVVFLLGGWALEKLRRRLVARIAGGAA